jgi:hypothetical protein
MVNRIRRRLLATGAVALLSTALAAGAAGAASASTGANQAVSYGEVAEFHCSPGQVTFDYLSVPYAELGGGYGGYPVYYEPVVFVYYSGAFHSYSTMRDRYNGTYQIISDGASEYTELPMTVPVPRGYSYRVYVAVEPTQPGYSSHTDPAFVDAGNGLGSSVCSA